MVESTDQESRLTAVQSHKPLSTNAVRSPNTQSKNINRIHENSAQTKRWLRGSKPVISWFSWLIWWKRAIISIKMTICPRGFSISHHNLNISRQTHWIWSGMRKWQQRLQNTTIRTRGVLLLHTPCKWRDSGTLAVSAHTSEMGFISSLTSKQCALLSIKRPLPFRAASKQQEKTFADIFPAMCTWLNSKSGGRRVDFIKFFSKIQDR